MEIEFETHEVSEQIDVQSGGLSCQLLNLMEDLLWMLLKLGLCVSISVTTRVRVISLECSA